MAQPECGGHGSPMVEIVLLVCTGLAFVALMAAVPLEMGEERREERARESLARER